MTTQAENGFSIPLSRENMFAVLTAWQNIDEHFEDQDYWEASHGRRFETLIEQGCSQARNHRPVY